MHAVDSAGHPGAAARPYLMFGNARQMVVKVYQPWRKWLVLVLLVLGLPLGSWGLFDYGRYRAGFDSGDAGRRLNELRTQLAEARSVNETLRQRLVTADQAREIDRQAYAEINNNLVALQDEILELKEEVAFYRGIVTPENAGATGVRVQSLHFAAAGRPRAYTYKLILTQVDKEAKLVRGLAKITVLGTRTGAAAEVPADRDSVIKFQFKYFGKSEGDIVLPEAFAPARVVVEVTTEFPKRNRAETVYTWQQVTL